MFTSMLNVYLFNLNFRSRRLTTTLMTWTKTLSPSDALVKNTFKTHFNKQIKFICILLSMCGEYENGWIWKVFWSTQLRVGGKYMEVRGGRPIQIQIKVKRKTSQECETALTSQYETLLLVFLSFYLLFILLTKLCLNSKVALSQWVSSPNLKLSITDPLTDWLTNRGRC